MNRKALLAKGFLALIAEFAVFAALLVPYPPGCCCLPHQGVGSPTNPRREFLL
jgi:hypothetical protein